jgi:hypothetical protein
LREGRDDGGEVMGLLAGEADPPAVRDAERLERVERLPVVDIDRVRDEASSPSVRATSSSFRFKDRAERKLDELRVRGLRGGEKTYRSSVPLNVGDRTISGTLSSVKGIDGSCSDIAAEDYLHRRS